MCFVSENLELAIFFTKQPSRNVDTMSVRHIVAWISQLRSIACSTAVLTPNSNKQSEQFDLREILSMPRSLNISGTKFQEQTPLESLLWNSACNLNLAFYNAHFTKEKCTSRKWQRRSEVGKAMENENSHGIASRREFQLKVSLLLKNPWSLFFPAFLPSDQTLERSKDLKQPSKGDDESKLSARTYFTNDGGR